METCPDCPFTWELVQREEVGPRIIAAASEIGVLLREDPSGALVRPTPDRWSAVEYGAHVRDVFLTIRDRLVIGLVEDDPDFKPLYRDERFDRGLYASDTAVNIADEIGPAANMLHRLFDAIDPSQLDRPVQYGWPEPATRTLLWMGQQAVHESEHHRDDIAQNLRR
jgi:S-DNA-T family DNA segregation ATPase FtsK/SpoIIIE